MRYFKMRLVLSRQVRQCLLKSSLKSWQPLVHVCQRHVATASNLADCFNGKKNRKFRLFSTKNVGLFHIPELTSVAGLKVVEEKCIQEIESLIQEACSPERKRKLVMIMDEMSDCICRVADMCEFLRLAHPGTAFREAAQATSDKLTELVEELNTNIDIHDALQHVADHGDVVPMTETDRLIADLFLLDHKQCGMHLDEDNRKKFVLMNNAVNRLAHRFLIGCQSPTPNQQFDLPPDLLSNFVFEGEKSYVRSLHHADYHSAEKD